MALVSPPQSSQHRRRADGRQAQRHREAQGVAVNGQRLDVGRDFVGEGALVTWIDRAIGGAIIGCVVGR